MTSSSSESLPAYREATSRDSSQLLVCARAGAHMYFSEIPHDFLGQNEESPGQQCRGSVQGSVLPGGIYRLTMGFGSSEDGRATSRLQGGEGMAEVLLCIQD